MKKLHDSLISIPNRHVFLEQVNQLIQIDPEQSLLLVDVVRFSDVSSSFGYDVGDKILLEIANRIAKLFHSKALLGRVSGDIFGLVIHGLHTHDQLHAFYCHLVEHFKTPISCEDHAFIADFNVGGASNPLKNRNVNSFFSLAESALKQAKSNKFDNFQYAKAFKDQSSGRSLALKADIARAFSNDELEIYFQPKIDLQNLKIVGAECLLRWNHPLDGVLFPGALIEAAESYNMMNEVGYWTLEQAFKSAVTLNNCGLELKISVNMSPTQLYDLNFVSNLSLLAAKYQVNFKQFELELTEDVALSNSFLVKNQLAEIRALGMTIAIDDFGKGYSNLAYMRDIVIDTIKIDKTFVMELDQTPVNRAIIEATQLIAKAANCGIVAEGIETLEHLHILREIGISQGQGFLFSKAVPIAQFIELAQQELIVGSSLVRKQRTSG
ncbi:putative bifunctional diguanylate cyclase/phosphodiesterase [Paraglaciecola hydrolytica]|uniref:Diguanylate phosphodiesterase n=1 Tax=Paraglaciecola hydrolytica TaxID=1799789 RepID=A0A136A0P9_9ALTE|nr:bifunctional diguanylate cyclase/phosphodiesterase [Paraglaciecola hydrolytica]KXI28784.1 diguanylate phosphodiesterase [Paraglaciecola hydrolytica]